MKRFIIFITIIFSVQGFSQEKYLQNNSIHLANEKSCNQTSSLYEMLYLNTKYNLSTGNFKLNQNNKFITGKVNAYHFAVFEKDIELTKAIDLKVEFHIDKYNNKMALLNVHIPLKFIQ
ncbi:MAG: hypothetical protein P8X62_12045 [Flavobacteriaceae bacterium]